MDKKPLTIGQIMNALEVKIFTEEPENDFQRKCIEREHGIKQYIDIVGLMIHQLFSKPGLAAKNLSFWKKAKIEECIKNLIDYTEELVGALDKGKIELYCAPKASFMAFERSAFEPDFTLLMLNSYYGAVFTDVYWIPELTVFEVMEISAGKYDLNELGKKMPDKISLIESAIKNNNEIFRHYNVYLSSVNEAIFCYKKGYNKAFNLLLLTSIEGLVRSLGAYLVDKQSLNINSKSDEYNSLDAFLRKIPWKEELKISKTQLSLLTSTYKRIDYNDPLAARPDIFEQINISIKTRLDFLRRRFKENRDLILHGQEAEYDKPYNGYINLSALSEVLNTIIKCHKLHDID